MLPERFTRTIVSLHGDGGAAWLAALPQTVALFAARWDLRVGPPFALSYHYVAPARRADGTAAVLKLGLPPERGLRDETEALRALDGGGAAGPLPPARFAEAERRFAELCTSTTQRVLLHGDLHDNVLAARRERWLAIDPKGMVGDPAYEPGALLRNPWDLLLELPDPRAVLDRRIDQLADGEGTAFPLACAELLSPPSR